MNLPLAEPIEKAEKVRQDREAKRLALEAAVKELLVAMKDNGVIPGNGAIGECLENLRKAYKELSEMGLPSPIKGNDTHCDGHAKKGGCCRIEYPTKKFTEQNMIDFANSRLESGDAMVDTDDLRNWEINK